MKGKDEMPSAAVPKVGTQNPVRRSVMTGFSPDPFQDGSPLVISS